MSISIEELAAIIDALTKQHLFVFEKELPTLPKSDHLFRVLADLLTSDRPQTQKNNAASSIQFLLSSALLEDGSAWPYFWKQFSQHILCNTIEWTHLNLMRKSFKLLLEQIDSDLENTLLICFSDMPFFNKIVAYECILEVQMDDHKLTFFIKETVEEYLSNLLSFIIEIHGRKAINSQLMSIEKAALKSIDELIKYLQCRKQNEKCSELVIKLCLCPILIAIIVEELLYRPLDDHYEPAKPDHFHLSLIQSMLLIVETDNIHLNQQSNEIKCLAIQILTNMVDLYNRKSAQQNFQYELLLSITLKIVPLILQQVLLFVNCGKKVQLPCFGLIISAHLCFLQTVIDFNYLFSYFNENSRRIICQLIWKLLATTDEQHRHYEQDSEEFISCVECLCETVEEPPVLTIKYECGKLLEKIVSSMDGALYFIVNLACQSIGWLLNKQSTPSIESLIEQESFQACLSTSLTILTILAEECWSREDLKKMVISEVLENGNMLQLKGLERCRFLIFLAYIYNSYFESSNEGNKFLMFASESLEVNETLTKCGLLVFRNCIKLGFSQDIWNDLLARVEKTKSEDIIKLLRKIVKNMLEKLPVDYVIDLIKSLITRLINEFQEIKEDSHPSGPWKCSPIMNRCLQVLAEISQNKQYLREEPVVINSLWDVFDLFEFVEKIEYEQDILCIFNNILKAICLNTTSCRIGLTHRYFLYLDYFSKISFKNKMLGQLKYTYIMLLQEGSDYFQSSSEAKQDLNQLIRTVQDSYSQVKQIQNLKFVCIIVQYAFQHYSHLIQFNPQLSQDLIKASELQRQHMQPEARAAIVNLAVTANLEFDYLDAGVLFSTEIECFDDYQGKVLAISLNKLIEKFAHSEQVLQFLRYGIKLLHFLRTQNSTNHHSASKYFDPKFKTYQDVDAFKLMRNALDYLRKHLSLEKYDKLMEQIGEEISLGEVRDLLSKRMVEKSCRTIHRVKEAS